MKGRVLVIAGSDSGGGAGIQADIKTITALNAYAATAITALTAQNTTGVYGITQTSPDFLAVQIECVLDDIGADAIKTGMLGDIATIEIVAAILARTNPIPLVLDPVMIAKGGQPLLAPDAIAALTTRLIPLATLITPNIPEAEILTGHPVRDLATQRSAAEMLLRSGARAVLLKGGHLPGPIVNDVLATAERTEIFVMPRIETRHTHGTGCTLASAIAAGLAQGLDLRQAVTRARAYVQDAIAAAPGYGAGHGPLNHAVWLDRKTAG